MKKTLVVLLAMMFGAAAANVQAANITFNPGALAFTVEPGNSAAAKIEVRVGSNAPFYSIGLQVGSVVAQGNLPTGWLKPATVLFNSVTGGNTPRTMDLVFDVPAGTAAGNYSAVLKPQVIRTSEPVVVSDIVVSIDVPSPESCAGVPALANVQVGPSNVWAPTEKEVEVSISGTVIVSSGCEVAGSYTMDSNGGVVSGQLNIDAAGNFAVKIPIKVAKDAKATEGTVYNGTLSVVDALGNSTSQEFVVQVDHDRGGKK